MDYNVRNVDHPPEARRAWVEPELMVLKIDETLGGTIPNSAEDFVAGNSGNRGAGS